MKESPVLMLSFWNPTPAVPSKGVFIHDQFQALSKHGTNIFFIGVNVTHSKSLFKISTDESEIVSNKMITINIQSIFWKFIYIFPFFVYAYLKSFLKRRSEGFRPAIVHSNIVFPCGFVGERLAKYYKVPHLISEHWTQVHKIVNHPVFGRKARSVYQHSDMVICVSRFLTDQIRAINNANNVCLVPNIVDTQLFCFHQKSRASKEFNFSCVASWRIPKRLDLIIDSLIDFASIYTGKIILRVIGDGEQVKHYKTVLLPQNLNIHWLGYLPKFKVAKVLAQSDFFMHASELETFSIVTAEALATGTPVLVSNIGALPELVCPNNGLLVENNKPAWVETLKQATSIAFDNEMIAQKIINKYSPDSVAENIESIYRKFTSA